VTLEDRRQAAQAVTGALWRWDRGFLLVAERPPEDLEPMSKATVRLSNELAAAQRELADARRALTERDEQVRVMSFVDGVTGLGNQQAFARTLDAEIHRAGRYGGPLCLVLAAIDGLDGVSLHLGGDQAEVVLRCFARVVGGALRKSDHVCRVGDDRFMLMLTHTPLGRAAAITDRIRTAFAAAAPGMVAASVAASFGNAAWREGDDAASLVARVEMALDAARAAGGGRAESA
jgi:diguanylate cyclase (GGDEF)-like protein